MFHLIWTVLIGFVVGLIAKMILPGKNSGGFIMTAILGIAGSFAARFLGELLHRYRPGQPAGFIGSVIGAITLLAVYHFIQRSRAA